MVPTVDDIPVTLVSRREYKPTCSRVHQRPCGKYRSAQQVSTVVGVDHPSPTELTIGPHGEAAALCSPRSLTKRRRSQIAVATTGTGTTTTVDQLDQFGKREKRLDHMEHCQCVGSFTTESRRDCGTKLKHCHP